MKIRINNRDLPYTIDTYGMFNGESAEESEREYYADEYNLTDIDFDYNHSGVVKHLAKYSVNLLLDNLPSDVVQDITLENTRSPQFYNYTTDSYTAIWTVDAEKLKQYRYDNRDAFAKWFDASEWSNDDLAENEYAIYLDFYTGKEYEPEAYENAIFEFEHQAWSENMRLDAESKKRLDKLEANKEAIHE